MSSTKPREHTAVSPNSIDKRLRVLTAKVLLINSISFLIFTIAGFFYTHSLKRALSDQVQTSIRRNLVTGDFRQAVLDVGTQSERHFVVLVFIRQATPVFILPAEKANFWQSYSNHLLPILRYARLSYPVYLDDNKTQKMGELHFIFDRFEALPFIVAAWLFVFAVLFLFFKHARSQLLLAQREELDSIAAQSISKLAAQVAHDIRSPLSALDSVIGDIRQLPEDERVMIRTAVNRIKDIANNLLEKHRDLRSASLPSNSPFTDPCKEPISDASVQLLSGLIDQIATEKRLQYRSKLGVLIDTRINASSYGIFSCVEPSIFKRILSNLIDNSVEAIAEKGAIVITLQRTLDSVQLRITDSGRGIAPDILPKLGKVGQTYGKHKGCGLGLHHARASLESWGGKLEIFSEIGKGTTIELSLPEAPPPAWFVSEILLQPASTVAVFDDDSSIHSIWQNRFDSLVQDARPSLIHLSTPEEFRVWISETTKLPPNVLFLVDYEILGHPQTGLDLIESLGIAKQSILVTSHFEEKHVKEGCERLGVRLIPKGMAGFVPILIEQACPEQTTVLTQRVESAKAAPDYVLIDDDVLVGVSWKHSARRLGKKVAYYKTPNDFLPEISWLPKTTPIYLDSCLGEDVQGEVFAKQLFEMGFSELWLCTGFPPEKFAGLNYLKGVQGKEPPWKKSE